MRLLETARWAVAPYLIRSEVPRNRYEIRSNNRKKSSSQEHAWSMMLRDREIANFVVN